MIADIRSGTDFSRNFPDHFADDLAGDHPAEGEEGRRADALRTGRQ